MNENGASGEEQLERARMKNTPAGIIGAVFFAMLFTFTPLAIAANNFIPIKLPYGVQVELPRNWVALSNNQRITLDSSVQARLEGTEIFNASSDLNFAANYYDDAGKLAAMMNIRYHPDTKASQAEVRSIDQAALRDIDNMLRESIMKAGQATGLSVLVWNGSSKQIINGVTTFVTEYKRSPTNNNGNFIVRLVNVFNNNKTFGLTVSYREDQEYLLRPICDRIISTLRIDR